ncbi:hypothetical protein A1O3_03688 [Capronia epimyces CBS 606.96]|uniref:Amidohydrolase-related domain-containing protein n=1 Tax=Capronia epimyces CBS 606.96 TaxID=1182542 RepID=W9YWS0_9EURO|nr:uncharacterized protein A1O3_03688 [Capronia epimyces CBS 606.96]EXJ86734.1 hypothetical protein A1O3_03688 [Capronia epimyces CBS 606.96]
MRLENIVLPGRDPSSRWEVGVAAGKITSIRPSPDSFSPSDPASLLLPSLCHPHIHLDKAYLLTGNSQHHPSRSQPTSRSDELPDYTDLTPQSGSFSEALAFTSRAKQRYTPADLHLRGSQLLATSLLQGVTSCRAFVELDHVTGDKCLEVAVALKRGFNDKLRLQICAFAQDPIFSTEHAEENRRILNHALQQYESEIEALGTTPYVEETPEASERNIRWAIETALAYSLHLDFHLDYNLDKDRAPMVWDVLRLLKQARWNERAEKGKTIVLGHCSRLTLCSDVELVVLAKAIRDSELPIHFVGLPTSDLFMMGRPQSTEARPEPSGLQAQDQSAHRPRGTLQVLDMIHRLGLSACLSVNNVGNAFTPWGTGDPLSLASLGVGIYQAGTDDDARTLFECVSSRARRALGLSIEKAAEKAARGQDVQQTDMSVVEADGDTLDLKEGRTGPFLLIRNEEWVGCPGHLGLKVPARQRVRVRDVVWDPPEIVLRQVIY